MNNYAAGPENEPGDRGIILFSYTILTVASVRQPYFQQHMLGKAKFIVGIGLGATQFLCASSASLRCMP